MYYSNSNFDRAINDLFNNNNWSRPTNTTLNLRPTQSEPYEVNYTKDGAYLLFEAPGFNKTNLKVELEDGILYIEGKRKYKMNEEECEKLISQKLKIGDEYDPTKVEATIEDGILTVFVQHYKKQEKKKRVSLL